MSDLQAYEIYVRWCKDRGMKPAEFKVWAQRTASLSEVNYAAPMK